jgi:hypothetical protein
MWTNGAAPLFEAVHEKPNLLVCLHRRANLSVPGRIQNMQAQLIGRTSLSNDSALCILLNKIV